MGPGLALLTAPEDIEMIGKHCATTRRRKIEGSGRRTGGCKGREK